MEVEWLKKKGPSSAKEKRRWIEPDHPVLSIARQCALVGLSRSTWYSRPAGESAENLALMRHLDEQWRIKAVVTEDHRLVTSGPYGLIRHPIFTAVLLLLISTASLLSEWRGIVCALTIYIYGTEIRMQAEDGLLLRRFGAHFREYSARVPAYLPFVR